MQREWRSMGGLVMKKRLTAFFLAVVMILGGISENPYVFAEQENTAGDIFSDGEPEDTGEEQPPENESESAERDSEEEALPENLKEAVWSLDRERQNVLIMTPSFSPEVYEYTVTVPAETTELYLFTGDSPDVKLHYISAEGVSHTNENSLEVLKGQTVLAEAVLSEHVCENQAVLTGDTLSGNYVFHIRKEESSQEEGVPEEEQPQVEEPAVEEEQMQEVSVPEEEQSQEEEPAVEEEQMQEEGVPEEEQPQEEDIPEEEDISEEISQEDPQENGILEAEVLESGDEGEYPEEEEENLSDAFLSDLEVYSNSSGSESSRQTLTRQAELDEEFGGRVYTVEYSSISSSTNFYVAAKLSESAPEGSEITMSGYTAEQTLSTVDIPPDSYDKGMCYRLTGSVFQGGEKGGRRAVYTIKAGTEENNQIYKILVYRSLELALLGCYDAEDADNAASLLDRKFNRAEREYSVMLNQQQEAVKFVIRPYSNCWYRLKVNGESWESTEPLVFPVTEESMEIIFSMSQEEEYNDPEYAGRSYTTENSYVIHITKNQSREAVFYVTPEDAVVSLYNSQGDRILPEDIHGRIFSDLMDGVEYTYSISCYGYQTLRGTLVAGETGEIRAELVKCDTHLEELTDNEWQSFRNNEENNGVTDVSIAGSREDAVLQWAVQLGGEWSSSSTPPLILDGCLYTAAGKYIYKLDKATGEVLAVSDALMGSMVYAMNPLAYAEGMVFAQIGNGQIQAYNARTLKSVWISEPLGGQTVSPITYKNGYIYTGTWNSETTAGCYFCLSVTDEDPGNERETKYCTWKYEHKGGFYWAGAYASDNYIVFGSDDGSQEGDYSDTSILYSVSSKTGLPIDMITQLKGDIRTSVVYENGYIYFATKGGYLYRIRMNADGSFGEMASFNLGGMATASPVVYRGRIYIGVCGVGGQFNPDSGHHFDVLQETDSGITRAYSVSVPGYPQAAALLSTAGEQEDRNGDGQPDGIVTVYFTINAYPGGIYVLEDAPGRISGKAELLFEPDTAQQQYGISPLCVDRDGTIYFKNDSCYLIAVTQNKAKLEILTASADKGKITWDKAFHTSRLNYQLTTEGQAEKVTLTMKAADNCTILVNGETCTDTYTVLLDENQYAQVSIAVENGGKTRTYKLEISGAGNDASLKKLIVSSSNSYSVDADYLGIIPDFDPDKTSYYTEIYEGTHSFLNIFVKKPGKNASVELLPVSGINKTDRFENGSSSDQDVLRFAVYFEEKEAEAVADIQVTSGDGLHKKTYRITLRRMDIYPPILTDISVNRKSASEAELVFTANEPGTFYYAITGKDESRPELAAEGKGVSMVQGENRLYLKGLSEEAQNIYILAADQKQNVMESPVKAELAPYRSFQVSIKAKPDHAKIVIKNSSGAEILPRNGLYTFLEGNTYTIIISCSGYVTRRETIVANASETSYIFTLESTKSSNANLKYLYVSSSGKYGQGIQLLEPAFDRNVTSYSSVYEGERKSLNLWLKAEDDKSAIKVYAVGGVMASTVLEDESLQESCDESGRSYWNICFANNQYEATVRVHVTAEDGTEKNTLVTLKMQDITAPVLKKVSASRISESRASVVYKISEKAECFYSVTEADSIEPVIDTGKDGIKVQEGTNTLTVDGLTRGEKDVYLVAKDSSGNVSDVLVIRIPDTQRGYSGQGQSGTGLGGQSSQGLGGSLAPALNRRTGTTGGVEGSADNLRRVNRESEQLSRNESGQQKEDEKDKLKKEKEKSGSLQEDNMGSTSENEQDENEENNLSDILQNAGNGSQALSRAVSFWKKLNMAQKGMFFFAGLGILFLLFWRHGKRYSAKRFA